MPQPLFSGHGVCIKIGLQTTHHVCCYIAANLDLGRVGRLRTTGYKTGKPARREAMWWLVKIMTVMIMVKVKLLLMGTNLFLRYCHLIASMCFFMFFFVSGFQHIRCCAGNYTSVPSTNAVLINKHKVNSSQSDFCIECCNTATHCYCHMYYNIVICTLLVVTLYVVTNITINLCVSFTEFFINRQRKPQAQTWGHWGLVHPQESKNCAFIFYPKPQWGSLYSGPSGEYPKDKFLANAYTLFSSVVLVLVHIFSLHFAVSGQLSLPSLRGR